MMKLIPSFLGARFAPAVQSRHLLQVFPTAAMYHSINYIEVLHLPLLCTEKCWLSLQVYHHMHYNSTQFL